MYKILGYFLCLCFFVESNALSQEIKSGAEQFKDTFFYNDILSAGGFDYNNYHSIARSRAAENPNNVCYNSQCLIPNFELLFGLGSDLARMVGEAERKNFVETLSNLKNRETKNISVEELSQIMSTVTEYFDSILEQDYKTWSDWSSGISETLKACEINFEALKTDQNKIEGYKLDAVIAKCKLDVFGVASLFSKEKSQRCLRLWNEGMKLIEFDQNTGSFDTFISDHFIKNPHLDSQLGLLYGKLVDIDSQVNKCFEKYYDKKEICFNPENYPNSVKNFDIGKEALKITGNFKDALVLVNVLTADPGQYAIQEKIIQGIRRYNPSRLLFVKKYFLNGLQGKFSSTLRVTKNLFGMNFQRKWSVRNYKALSGLNIGLGLSEKGFTESESAWFSRIINEAYKAQVDVLHDYKERKKLNGNKPYFVIDSSAAYTGAVVASRFYNGASLEKFELEQLNSTMEKGTALATSDWNWGMRAVGVLKVKDGIAEKLKKAKNLLQ